MAFTPLTSGLAATPPVDTPGGPFNWQWLRWFGSLGTQIAANPSRVTTVLTTAQSASIPTTAIGTDPLPGGAYRLNGYVRVTSPALTSSSVSVSIGWTDGGVSCSRTLIAAVTGNTVDANGGGVEPISIDASTPISYSTTYASNGANEMVYALTIVLESLGAA